MSIISLIKKYMSKCQYCDKQHERNNTGCNNSGDWNSGYRNSGDWNSGYRNSGDWNSGYRNSGYWNSGDWNSGDWNSGYRNSGYWNSGDWNSGDWNSGDWNSGDWNSGYWNSGDWNSGYWNSGYFNTNSPDKIRVFNQWLDMTHEEFNDKYNLYADIPLNRWINKDDMTESEKSKVEGWEQMGGYLKTLDFKEACKIWWDENPSEHKRFLEIPGFDWDIFTEITGIEQTKENVITINGKEYSESTIKKALQEYVK